MKSLLIASLLAVGFAGSASASTFIESKTNAQLNGPGDDEVMSIISIGTQSDELEASFGVGYGDDQAVANLEVRGYKYLGSNMTLEAEVNALYLTESDKMILSPELRVRKYF